MKQQQLNQYFSTLWQPKFDQYNYSGYRLIEQIKESELVLDIGCGTNPFKGKIKNLIGIDPAFSQADYQTTIEDFTTDKKFDVALCLGSINFGTEETILRQIESIVSLLKAQARIYWRCNPGLQDHGNNECQEIDFFPWTFQHHLDYSERFGFSCPVLAWDNNNRIYAEWSRSA
jgi:hypothetical protein